MFPLHYDRQAKIAVYLLTLVSIALLEELGYSN